MGRGRIEGSPSTGASSILGTSVARRPRDAMPECPTQIQRGLVNGKVVVGGPQLQRVAVVVALVTVVAPGAQVDRERPTPRPRRAVDETGAVQLNAAVQKG
jgi:hypothetical protein